MWQMIDAGQVAYRVFTLRPEDATAMLRRNTHNRNKKPISIEKFANEMAAGRWVLNFEAIKFGANGQLLDGQNRLFALESLAGTGVSIEALVTAGASAEAQATMDLGARRSSADQLRILGLVVDSTGAAAARVYMEWSRKQFSSGSSRIRPSVTEINAWCVANPDIMQLLGEATAAGYRKIWMPPSVALAASARLVQVDRTDGTAFMSQLKEGFDLHEGHPVAALRSRLDSIRINRIRTNERDYIGYTLQAWNAFRRKTSIRTVAAPKGGWTDDNIPDPI